MEPVPSFFHFYLQVAARFPQLLFQSALEVEGILMGVAFFILLANRPLGKRLLHWEGISAKWALIPVAALFLVAILRANHASFLDQGASFSRALHEAESETETLRRGLSHYRDSY